MARTTSLHPDESDAPMSTAAQSSDSARVPLGSSGRAMRADARRNRELILEAARELLAEQPDASTAAVAKHAGVGVGTLFRHFPTRLELVEALYEDELVKLGTLADQVVTDLEPWSALETWVKAFAAFSVAKRTTFGEVINGLDRDPERGQGTRDRIDAAVGTVLARAQEAGVADPNLGVHDLVQLVGGVALFPFGDGARTVYLVQVVLRGIRTS